MNEVELRKDWLASNAVVAFVGAFLLAKSWQMSEGTVKLLFIFTVPNYTGLVIFIIIAGLFILSLFLALSTAVPVRGLQCWAIKLGKDLSQILGFLTVVGFFVGLTSEIRNLPLDQWWSWFLIVGGFVLSLFLVYRMVTVAKVSRRCVQRPD